MYLWLQYTHTIFAFTALDDFTTPPGCTWYSFHANLFLICVIIYYQSLVDFERISTVSLLTTWSTGKAFPDNSWNLYVSILIWNGKYFQPIMIGSNLEMYIPSVCCNKRVATNITKNTLFILWKSQLFRSLFDKIFKNSVQSNTRSL
jgi:hypothetical protein